MTSEPLTVDELDIRELVFKIAELVSLSKVELACIHMRAALNQELQSHSRQLWLEAENKAMELFPLASRSEHELIMWLRAKAESTPKPSPALPREERNG